MSEHIGLKNLYNQVIANKFGWDRWGLLGALSDCVLNYVPGDILEIGCGESSIILSKLAEKYNRTCYHVEYSKSGVENMKNTKGYFGKNSKVYNCMSSSFFEQFQPIEWPRFALAFIDGDHVYEEVKKDFYSTLEHLGKGGFIFLHDTLPPDESWTVEHKCGGVFKLRRELEDSNGLFDIFTFPFTAFGVGLTMVRRTSYREWEIMGE